MELAIPSLGPSAELAVGELFGFDGGGGRGDDQPGRVELVA